MKKSDIEQNIGFGVYTILVFVLGVYIGFFKSYNNIDHPIIVESYKVYKTGGKYTTNMFSFYSDSDYSIGDTLKVVKIKRK